MGLFPAEKLSENSYFCLSLSNEKEHVTIK